MVVTSMTLKRREILLYVQLDHILINNHIAALVVALKQVNTLYICNRLRKMLKLCYLKEIANWSQEGPIIICYFGIIYYTQKKNAQALLSAILKLFSFLFSPSFYFLFISSFGLFFLFLSDIPIVSPFYIQVLKPSSSSLTIVMDNKVLRGLASWSAWARFESATIGKTLPLSRHG